MKQLGFTTCNACRKRLRVSGSGVCRCQSELRKCKVKQVLDSGANNWVSRNLCFPTNTLVKCCSNPIWMGALPATGRTTQLIASVSLDFSSMVLQQQHKCTVRGGR